MSQVFVTVSAGPAAATVTTATFDAFDGREAELRNRGVRLFPDTTTSLDFEPEYIAIDPDGTTAFATLQEANAFAVVDLASTVPDRGPNGEPTDVDEDGENERPFALPDYQAQVIPFEVDPTNGAIFLGTPVLLWRADGTTPITGLPNIPGIDEEPVDLFGNALPYDAFGADMEGVVRDPAGDLWMVDEYSNRRRNRGFEAMALDAEAGILYALIQTPLANPDRAASDGSDVIRILGVDVTTGQPVLEHICLLEGSDFRAAKVDKIGDAVWAGNGKLFVIERDSSTEANGKKLIFEIDLRNATNLLAPGAPSLLDGLTLERMGGIAVFDVQNPRAPFLVDFVNPRDFSGDAEAGTAGDLGPESLLFIKRDPARGTLPLLVVANEVSGSVTVFRVVYQPPV